MEALRLGRKLRSDELRHEVDAKDGTDHAEGVGYRIADRRILALHHIERRLQRGSAGHRSGVDAERVADLDAKSLAEAKGDPKTGEACDQREQVIFASGAPHSFEELPAVQDPDSV